VQIDKDTNRFFLVLAWRSRVKRYLSLRRDLFHSRRLLSTCLLVLGGGLLLFAASSYGWMLFRQHQLALQWQSQTEARPISAQPPAASDHNGVTLLSIPKIGLHAGILDGTDRKSLLLAPGHLKDTAWPGDSGNAVIAGHRDTFFRHLHELGTGDEIFILRNGRRFRYVVTNKMVVDPDEIGLIEPTSDNRLTLITCYPTYYIGSAPKRLVVVGRLQPESPAVAQTSTDLKGSR
jgi:sortase A